MDRHDSFWHIPNFNSIYLKGYPRKVLENWIISKRHNSSKTRSTETKIELDLYYHRTNSYTKFLKSISQGMSKKKSGKLKCDGYTNRWTDKQRANLESPWQAGRGLKKFVQEINFLWIFILFSQKFAIFSPKITDAWQTMPVIDRNWEISIPESFIEIE